MRTTTDAFLLKAARWREVKRKRERGPTGVAVWRRRRRDEGGPCCDGR
jgi:hypothetical protein